MDKEIIYQSDDIIITRKGNDFFMQTLKEGMSINDFNSLLIDFPQIEITSFMAIKNTLSKASQEPIKFGENKPPISVEISSDAMKAFVTLNIPRK